MAAPRRPLASAFLALRVERVEGALVACLLAACGGEAPAGDAGGGGGSGAAGGGGASSASSSATSGASCASVGEPCAPFGATRCVTGQNAEQKCVEVEGCKVWSSPSSCSGGTFCGEGSCRPCEGAPGSHHDQTLEVDGEARYYFLHVPASYACSKAAPLLVDFHGTAGSERPEESYRNGELVALAEAEGAIVVRPRSRSSEEGGIEVYRWDQNPGDLEKNEAFTAALVADLGKRFHLDPSRRYASGFSSGTNMAAQLLDESPVRFRGFGLVAGGAWHPTSVSMSYGAPRLYATTGYRDYLLESQRDLLSLALGAGVPEGEIFVRRADAGHELYGWHFGELFAWLDRGERPEPFPAAATWTSEAVPGNPHLVELALAPEGRVVATAEEGRFLVREPGGAWSEAGAIGEGVFTGLCFLEDGRGFAVGEGALATSEDGGKTWQDAPPVPELQGTFFGASYLNAIACSDGTLLAGGYWTGVTSEDGGASWQGAPMPNFGFFAQVASVAIGSTGTALSVGYYDYVGRRAPDAASEAFEPIAHPAVGGWWNAVAPAGEGRFWVVGESGSMLVSKDDGLTFEAKSAPKPVDLYAVAFRDALVGAAAGRSGSVFLTEDGGETWKDVSPGGDRALTGLAFLAPDRLLAVGEGGAALVLPVAP